MVEEEDAEEEDDHRDGNTVKQVRRIDTAGAKGCVTEGLDQRRHGIGQDEPAIVFRDCRQGVDHGCGVHEELDAETHKLLQIAVTGGE
jgi:hypothetical protein